MLHGVGLVALQGKRARYPLVTLDELGGGEARRDARAVGVVGYEVGDAVNATVHGAAVRPVGLTEVDAPRAVVEARHVHGVLHQLLDALVLGGRDGHHRHAQQALQGVNVHRAAVCQELVHHVERDDHGDVEFDELARHHLLARVGREGVDTRKVRDRGLGVGLEGAVLAVHRDAGEVAHVLV